MFRRFARLAVMLAALVAMLIAAGIPTLAGEARPSESTPAEEPPTQPVHLALRALCTAGQLHRFAVDNVAGPATEFEARLVGEPGGETLTIAAGATRYFWVTAAQPGTTAITWPDGTASASQSDQPCDPDADAPVGPEPEMTERSPSSSDDASAEGATPAPRAGTTSEAPAPAEAPPSSAGRRAAAGRQPRPTAQGTDFACPDGWIAVDSDGDRSIDDADDCEAVIGAPASAQRSPVSWPAVTLVVTLALLVFAIGLGATTRRSP